MPTELIDPVTQTAAANLSSGAGNLTQLEMERMRQRGASARQSEALDHESYLHEIDQNFQRELVQGSQNFQREQMGSEQAFAREQQQTSIQASKEQIDAERKWTLHLDSLANARAAAAERYRRAVENARLDEAGGIQSEMEDIDKQSTEAQKTLSRLQLSMGLISGTLKPSTLADIHEASDQYATGLTTLHNQARETLLNSVADSFTAGLTTDSLKKFLKTTRFTPDSGASSARAIGSDLISSFTDGAGMAQVLDSMGVKDPQGKMAVKEFLNAAVAAVSAPSRPTESDHQRLQQSFEVVKGFLHDHEINTILESFAGAFSSASSTFKFKDLKNLVQGGKLAPTREAEEELRKVFDNFAKVGSLKSLLGLKSADEMGRELKYGVSDMLMRLEQLSPEMVNKVMKGLDPQKAARLRQKMLEYGKLQEDEKQKQHEYESTLDTVNELGTRATKVRNKIGGRRSAAEDAATEDYLKLLETPLE